MDEHRLLLEGEASYDRMVDIFYLSLLEGPERVSLQQLMLIAQQPPQYRLHISVDAENATPRLLGRIYTCAGYKPPIWASHLHESIDHTKLSTRAWNALEWRRVSTLGDLARCTEAEILLVKNIGRTTLTEIIAFAAEYGLALGVQKIA